MRLSSKLLFYFINNYCCYFFIIALFLTCNHCKHIIILNCILFFLSTFYNLLPL